MFLIDLWDEFACEVEEELRIQEILEDSKDEEEVRVYDDRVNLGESLRQASFEELSDMNSLDMF